MFGQRKQNKIDKEMEEAIQNIKIVTTNCIPDIEIKSIESLGLVKTGHRIAGIRAKNIDQWTDPLFYNLAKEAYELGGNAVISVRIERLT